MHSENKTALKSTCFKIISGSIEQFQYLIVTAPLSADPPNLEKFKAVVSGVARMSLGRCSQPGRQAGEGYGGGRKDPEYSFIQCLLHSSGHAT